jgi:hypothetical protein
MCRLGESEEATEKSDICILSVWGAFLFSLVYLVLFAEILSEMG